MRPCELRRQPNGTWRRTYLGPGIAYSNDDQYQDIAVSVFIPEKMQGQKYALKLKDSWVRHEFETIPDFTNTYSTPTTARVIAGCLVLAYHEKDPTRPTQREEDFVRLIAISIEVDGDIH